VTCWASGILQDEPELKPGCVGDLEYGIERGASTADYGGRGQEALHGVRS
jgi:hypothetical protein